VCIVSSMCGCCTPAVGHTVVDEDSEGRILS